MWKVGADGLKWMKILHLVLIVLFLGGIVSSYALTLNLDLSNFEEVYRTYKGLGILSEEVVKIGALGTIGLGLVYGFFTRWGFVKHRWLAVKWVLFIVLTFVGVLVVDRLRVTNLALLESGKAAALGDPVFAWNHQVRQYTVGAQIAITLAALGISVGKPWRNRGTGK